MARLTIDQKIEKAETKIKALKKELKGLKKLKKKEEAEAKKAKATALAEKLMSVEGLESMSEEEMLRRLKS